MSERAGFTSSAAIGVAGNRALELAGVGIDDVAHLDVYSCFPSAVQLALRELGIDPDRQLTVYGGLCFAGGPWNNPVGHAIASMVGVLRDDPGSAGAWSPPTAATWTKHAFGVYSTEPPDGGFRWERPQDEIDAAGGREVSETYEGPVTLETWTVMHERDGSMSRGHAACLTPDGVRVWALTDDADTMKRFESEDMVGAPGTIGPEGALDAVTAPHRGSALLQAGPQQGHDPLGRLGHLAPSNVRNGPSRTATAPCPCPLPPWRCGAGGRSGPSPPPSSHGPRRHVVAPDVDTGGALDDDEAVRPGVALVHQHGARRCAPPARTGPPRDAARRRRSPRRTATLDSHSTLSAGFFPNAISSLHRQHGPHPRTDVTGTLLWPRRAGTGSPGSRAATPRGTT